METKVDWPDIYGALGDGIRARTQVDALTQVFSSSEFNVWEKVKFGKAVLGIKGGDDDAERNDN